jgi:alanyl-tRNA synthetase
MTPEEAIAAGAMALFGEKYGEEVRVLSMGGQGRRDLLGRAVRRHPCAAHRRHRLFRIVGEGAVSAGVRRIEALAGKRREEHVRHQIDL